MSRQQLKLRVSAADVPHAEALLELAGAESLTLSDAGDDPVFEPPPNETPLWPGVEVRALFADAVDLEPLCILLASSCASATAIEAARVGEEWRDAARRGFTARRFGERLWLAPANDPTVPAGLVGVTLHMGLAFGTGEHPTTALCLEWIDARPPRDARVLDYGCGSGVLAIAALAFGARAAWAIDNDPQAIAATRDNAALNGCSDGRLFVGLPEELPDNSVDVVLANILAAPLIALAPELARRVVPGGSVVLSGVLERQVADVVAAYEPYFDSLAHTTQGGWARIDGVRRPA